MYGGGTEEGGEEVNYLNNPVLMSCCPLNDFDAVKVEKRIVLEDMETEKAIGVCEQPELGKTYQCKETWVLLKGYLPTGYYATEDQARVAYEKLVSEFNEQGRVFCVK